MVKKSNKQVDETIDQLVQAGFEEIDSDDFELFMMEAIRNGVEQVNSLHGQLQSVEWYKAKGYSLKFYRNGSQIMYVPRKKDKIGFGNNKD